MSQRGYHPAPERPVYFKEIAQYSSQMELCPICGELTMDSTGQCHNESCFYHD